MGAHMREAKNAGGEAIVKVGGEIGNLIGQVDELRFEGWLLIEKVLREFRVCDGIVVARVLDDAFAHAEGEIEAGKSDIALLESGDNAKRVQIVVETETVRVHGFVERALTGMAEWRVADVLHQRERFCGGSVEA